MASTSKNAAGLMNGEQVERHLRYRITGLLHVGRLRPGDLLPSIRSLAREIGADHRVVAGAYRALEAEGLAEIRPGSGVYLAGGAPAGCAQTATARWLSGVLLEGWSRGVPRGDLAALVERCAASRVRCACIESNEDHMAAVVAELEGDFSLDVQPVLVSPSADAASIPAPALAGADLVVTTVFHEAAGRCAAARVERPCEVLSLNPEFASAVNHRLAGRQTTAVFVDPRFGARARAYLDVTPHRGNVRLVLVDELGASPETTVDLESEDVLLTLAARRRLGLPEYHLVPSPPAFISPESARALCEQIVAIGLQAAG